MRIRLDHLLLGVPDLEAGVDWLQAATGVRAAGAGTWDDEAVGLAFASLSGRAYLAVVGPDGSAAPSGSLGARLGAPAGPRLIGWAGAVDAGALDGLAGQARAAGLAAVVGETARRRPDGRTVVSRHLTLEGAAIGGLAAGRGGADGRAGSGAAHLPVFVEAGRGAHPSIDAPGGLRLRSFSVADPAPDGLRKLLEGLGVEVEVVEGAPGLAAVLSSPTGEITLGS
ncbi:MAG TPA: VOC family protein [Acidimicrobiia bacterium]|nr:VOC family protein [Acidimicrobiia bacterium]